MDVRQHVLEVLNTTHLMSLATQDKKGVWVADVIFVHDDGLRLYWMSDPDCRHSKAILMNHEVAGSITVSTNKNEMNFGIQFAGIAERIAGDRYDLAEKHFTKRGHPAPKDSDDILQGDSWYRLTPTKIRLIDEKQFGFTAQDVPL